MRHLIEVLTDNIRDKLGLSLMFGRTSTIDLLTDTNELILKVEVLDGNYVSVLTFELFAPLNNIQNHINEGTGQLETKIHLNIPEVAVTSVTIGQKNSNNKIRLDTDNDYEVKDMVATYLSNLNNFKCLFNGEEGINTEVVLDNEPLNYTPISEKLLENLFLAVVYGKSKGKKSIAKTVVVGNDTQLGLTNKISFNSFSDEEEMLVDAKVFARTISKNKRSLISFMDFDNVTMLTFLVEKDRNSEKPILRRISANNNKGLEIKNIFDSLLN